ncbi:hypothetical protein WME90_40775 [Sorangium sp. So ce375]|uniref:hypothetical protein n=1 Tax=Sorangium sp. So ce375 TaxID=3133306 RepID=UPI003F5B62A9
MVQLIMRPDRSPLPNPADEPVIGHWPVFVSDTYYDVAGLKAGYWLVARQVFGTRFGDLSEPVQVRADDAPLSDPVFDLGQLYACSACVYLLHGTPGAKLTIEASGRVIGTGEVASDGVSRVELAELPRDGDTLSVAQEAAGALRTTKGPVVQRPSLPLPAPIVRPLYEFQRDVTVDGILPSANVKIFVDGAPAWSGCTAGSQTVRLLSSLEAGQQVTASQDFSVCQWASPLSTAVAVSKDPPPAPTIASACVSSYVNGVYLDIKNLVAGATVQLHVTRKADGVVEEVPFVARTPDGIADDRYLFRNVPEGTITARQGFADTMGVVHRWSDDSPRASISYRARSPLVKPIIPDLLYQCSRAIYVYAPHGAIVRVFSTMLRREIALPTRVTELRGGVEILTEPLVLPDTIYAVAEGCDGERSPSSDVVPVQPISRVALAPPGLVGTLSVNGRFRPLVVSDIVPGAVVTLSLNGKEIPGISIPSAASSRDIELPHAIDIHPGDIIRARQTLCDQTTAWSAGYADVVA